MPQMRLDKLLSHLNCGSRKEVQALIRAGRVSVDGTVQKIRRSRSILIGRRRRWMAPCSATAHSGTICSTSRWALSRQAAMSATIPCSSCFRPSLRRGLFAVGRLDKDTEGLLLITDDGALSHALMSPNRHVEKEYEAVVDGVLAADAVLRFEQGMTLRDGTECKPAKLEILETEPELRVRVTLKEGKYHQVKRMIAAVGGTVTALKRLRLGGLWLDKTLAPGEFRELTQEELEKLTSQT